jgi:Arc/MetJ-type ribon-helix-helix transcriptional regulator
MGVVKVTIPDEMHQEIRELVKRGKYRSVADFFYIAGRRELERIKSEERLQQWERMQEEGDCEIISDAEVLP